MPNIFLVSDTHFGHSGMCRFLRDDGVTKLRPWTDPDEMDEVLVKNWNDRVKPGDKVYHLGDVVIGRKQFKTLYRLNGDKVLIRGNHDIYDLSEYAKHFRDVRGSHVMDGMILTHLPLHPDSVTRFGCNVHGHLHARNVMMPRKGTHGADVIDPRYFNVSVEQHDWSPIHLEDAIEMIKRQGGTVEHKNGNEREL